MLPLGITRGSSRTMCCLLLPKALISGAMLGTYCLLLQRSRGLVRLLLFVEGLSLLLPAARPLASQVPLLDRGSVSGLFAQGYEHEC